MRWRVWILIATFATTAAAQEGLSGSSSSVFQDQRSGEQSTSTLQESLNLNYNTILSPEWRTSLYGNVLWQDNSELENPDFRPYLGASLSSDLLRLNSTYSFLEDRNYSNATGNLHLQNWSGTLGIQIPDLPALLGNYAVATGEDDFDPKKTDYTRTTWSFQASERLWQTLDLYYLHSETEDVDRVGQTTGEILFQQPTYLAVDASQAVYVVDAGAGKVLKFNAGGGLILSFSGLTTPTGIAVDSSGNVYVVDSTVARIRKYDGNGTFLLEWGAPGIGDGQFDGPTALAADSTGLYVADTNNHRIQKFNFTGGFLLKWGSAGGGAGQFLSPQGIASDGANVYVADTNNHRVQKFTTAGAFDSTWGGFGSGNGQFVSPRGIAADSFGSIFVADTGNQRIQRFSGAGAYTAQWGSAGSGNGQFADPIGIAADALNNVFVADTGNDRVQRFLSNGSFVTKWGNTLASTTGETTRRSRTDSFGGSFTLSFRNALTVGANFGATRTTSGDIDSTNVWLAPSLRVRLLRPLTAGYDLNLQRLESAVSGAESTRQSTNHDFSLSFTPWASVSGALIYHYATVRESAVPDVTSSGPGVTLSLRPLAFASLNLSWAQSTNETDGQSETQSSVLSAFANVIVYKQNAVTIGYSHATSSTSDTDTEGVVDTLAVEGFVFPWKIVRLWTRGTYAVSAAAAESKSTGASASISWMMSEGASLTNASSFTQSDPSAGDRTRQWTNATSFSASWAGNTFSIYYQASFDKEISHVVGLTTRIAVSRASTIGLFAQQDVGDFDGGGRTLRFEFAVAF